ncbi:MAG: DUF2171 domain-containing protein [Sphingomonas sp.]|uniref:DUF2171 domain-containing protein n=1 Tax=Sphingomonas sp. TaxID=28214 RepID=UPI003F809A98
MAYERYPRGNSLQGDYYGQAEDDARRHGADQRYVSSARDYEAAGMIGPRRGADRYRGDYDRGYYSQGRNADFVDRGYSEPYRGSYTSDGHRFTEVGDRRDDGDRDYGRSDMYRGRRSFERDPRDYSYEDRTFFARAGDEVRSWFGDEDAERRRVADQRYDQRYGGDRFSGHRSDSDYHTWRAGQMAALDRDYDEYRRENQQKFSNEFGSWRNERQTQRSSLARVTEHMDVVGSDGEHIGTVDKVRGDRILLTKSDPDAGGRHHSIPSRWIERVDDKVTVRKTADEAKAHWRDEERSAFFGGDSAGRDQEDEGDGRILNRSFSGTY